MTFGSTPTEAVIKEARTWVGVPWHHQGRNRHGIDCAGLIIKIAESFGVFIPDLKIYPQKPDQRLMDVTTRYLLRCDLAPACICLFEFSNAPWHVGLYTGESLIHAWDAGRRKQVIESEWNRYWERNLHRCFRFPG